MMKKLRLAALLCALLMLTSLFAACKGKEEEPPQDTGATTTQTPSSGGEGSSGGTAGGNGNLEQTEAEMYRPDKINWGTKDGPYEYRMLVSQSITYSKDYWVENEELVGDALNTAMADRADFLSEYFNIAFEVEFKPDTYVTTGSNAQTDFADIVVQWAGTAYSGGVLQGHYLDLNKLDSLNLEASYWDQRIQQDYNIGGRLFSLEGDFSVMDELCTQVILFNADLYEKYGYKQEYGSPYAMVSDGRWTFDNMLEMYQGTSQSTNGVSLTKDDVWGMFSEVQAPYALFIGSGRKVAQSTGGDIKLVFDNNFEDTYNVIADIMDRFGMDDECLFVACWNGKVLTGSNDVWEQISDMFKANQALFRSTALIDATFLRDMEATFGVLPIPMYTEKQEGGYYSLLGMHCPLFIPQVAKSNGHLETTAALTEGLAFFSRYADNGQSLYDAFFENMTYVKLCRNEEDRAMLELIFANKAYDMDKTMNLAGVNEVISNAMLVGRIDTLFSDISSLKTSASVNLQEFLDKISKKVE